MPVVYDLSKLSGHTYSDKDGFVRVQTPSGEKPSRKVIFRLLSRARKKLIEDKQ